MRGKAAGVILMLCLPTAATAQFLTNNIVWPELGRFPAYPPEPDEPVRPWQLWAAIGGYYDSNLFRLADGVNPQTAIGSSSKSDTVGIAALGFKADVPISRQRLLFDAAVDYSDFSRFDFLDNTGYRVRGAWEWQAADQWSGDVGGSTRRFLSGFNNIQAPIKDMITEDRLFGTAGYRFTPRWRVRGGVDWYQWTHSNLTRRSLDNDTTSGLIGIDYLTPADNSVGALVRYTNARFPNREVVAGTLVDNQYDQIDAGVVVHWVATGLSTLDARLGYTDVRYAQLAERDFSGVTGNLSWDWTPGTKTVINFSAWREIRLYEDASATYILAQGVSVGPQWAPTYKLVFQAKLLYEHRDFKGDPGYVLQAGPQREDRFRGGNLMAGWSPVRWLQLALAAEAGKQTSNIAGKDFDYYRIWANAKFLY
jgi:exopolysaccharide biosynthesis operon protein EpsL